MKNIIHVLVIAAVAVMCIGEISMARPKTPPPPELTESGQKLAAEYTSILEALKADIKKSIPGVDEKKMAAFTKAAEAEKSSEARLKTAQDAFGPINQGRGLVAHAKGKWIGGAERGIAETKEKIKNAKTDEERKAAQEQLAKWEQNKIDGENALKERQAKLDEALAREPQLTKERDAATEALARAQATTVKALKKLGLDRALKSDKLDAKLAKHYILSHGTPQGLAAFAQQGRSQENLIEQLLSDDDLMIQMASADGANGGNYGGAMEVYNAIQKASKNAKNGVLQRLAVGTALELAGKGDAAVKRYLHFEKAYLDGELDPAFKTMTPWDYRNVVNGDESEKSLAWGREMLKNYRPDHITTPDYRWRYVGAVRSDIKYGSGENKYDKPELERYQNILMNGGVCGRRAFFGRFILRSFGIPTVARPQRGHAALAHWTPDGWVVCLGGGWGAGWVGTGGRGRTSDLDFLAVTQGRATGEPYKQVLRAQWIGDVLGEPRAWGLKSGVNGTWNNIALYQQRAIIAEAKAVTLAAVGEDIGEANVTSEKIDIVKVQISDADRKIHVDNKGAIIIPAAATTEPKESTGKIIFMDSVLGGKQLHYSRNGGNEDFIYTFDAPAAGKYAMSMKVVTPSWKQKLTVAANDNKPIEMELPHTVGMWEDTEPVKITLAKGKNALTFSRNGVQQEVAAKGFTLKEITLTPVK